MLDKLKHWLAGNGLQVRQKKAQARGTHRRVGRPVRVQEQACPHCGEPMLAAWGTTCGVCRPGTVAPRTLDLSTAVRPGAGTAPGLVLGWLVVVQSPDEARRGALIQLTAPVSVLSRGLRPMADQGWFDINDEFMSNGHASIARPMRDEREACFSIRDRQDPGPSANGTFVNARRLAAGESLSLSEGDSIRVGATLLVFKSLWLPPCGPGSA